LGIFIILIYSLLLKRDFLFYGKVIEGVVYVDNTYYGYNIPIKKYIIYKFKNDKYELIVENDKELQSGEIVKVIFQKNIPEKAYKYSFIDFWISPLLICILPLMVLAAASFSFLKSTDYILLDLRQLLKFQSTKKTKNTKAIVLKRN
jgi:hypothetical protein